MSDVSALLYSTMCMCLKERVESMVNPGEFKYKVIFKGHIQMITSSSRSTQEEVVSIDFKEIVMAMMNIDLASTVSPWKIGHRGGLNKAKMNRDMLKNKHDLLVYVDRCFFKKIYFHISGLRLDTRRSGNIRVPMK